MIAGRRVPRSTEQGGYALIAVLVAIGVFSIIVLALLDMVNMDSGTTVASRDTARVRRASDGALQTGIAQMKATSRARLLSTPDPCAGLDAIPPPSNAASSPQTSVRIEEVDVNVDCVVPPTLQALSVPSSGQGGDVLTLSGDYDIGVDATGAQVKVLIEFIRTLLGQNTPANAVRYPGIIHVADEPARIWGDVKVRQWGFTATPKAAGPAINITGTYAQGDPDGGACGAWDGGSAWFDPPKSFDVAASGGRTCGNGSEAARNAVGIGAAPQAASIASSAVTLPTCASDSVVTLEPGAYTPAQVATLNTWFQSNNGSCDRVTFWFRPGDYFFDATADYSVTKALVFDDPTSEFVFGAPSGWTPAGRATSAFPEACDRKVDGVSIVLGPTTSLQQMSGRVAMCGRHQNGADLPMVSQQGAATLADEAWAGEPDTVTAAYNTVNNGQAVAATIAVPGGEPGGYPALGKRYDGSEATRQVSTFSCDMWSGYSCGAGYRLSGLASATSAAPGRALSTAKVRVLGSSVNMQLASRNPGAVGDTRMVVSVYAADGTTLLCQAVKTGWLPYQVTDGPVDIDLMPTCATTLTSAKVLEAAKIDLTITANGSSCGLFCVNTPSVSLDYVWVETHTGSGPSPNPLPMNINIDGDPAMPRSFNAFGQISVPRTQIDVKWRGSAGTPPTYEVPVFVGSVYARALASSTLEGPVKRHVGPLASRTLIPVSRHVLLRSSSGGRLLGTAEINIVDTDAAVSPPTILPAARLDVIDWKYCNVPLTPTATC